MSHYVGKDLFIRFRNASGTVILSGDQQKWDDNSTTNLADTTAGADAADGHVPTYRSVDGSFDLVADTGGSAIYAAIVDGTAGTLEWGPRGTTTGYPKYEIACTFTSVKKSAAYDSAVKHTYNWKGNGDWISHWEALGDTY